jgi:hypothetical protein
MTWMQEQLSQTEQQVLVLWNSVLKTHSRLPSLETRKP